MACYIIYECDYLNEIEKLLKVDLIMDICNLLKSIIVVENIDPNIIDVSLEGISYIWLKYPEWRHIGILWPKVFFLIYPLIL